MKKIKLCEYGPRHQGDTRQNPILNSDTWPYVIISINNNQHSEVLSVKICTVILILPVLSVIMLSSVLMFVVILAVIMLSVVILVVVLNVIMLTFNMTNVAAPVLTFQ